MRKIFIALCTMISVITGNAQNTPIGENIELAGENPEELKVIYVNKDVSTHFIAMEDIKYVDISVNDIVGDIPTGNSLRIKPTKEGASGVITIVTERFFVQYMLVYSSDLAKAYTRFNIPYADLRSYMNPEVNLTKAQMYDYAHRMFISKNKFYDVSSKSNLMKIVLNNIYTLDKYFFIDISMINKTKIRYDIDQIRFKIEDKKQTKATNFQSIEILPLMQVNKNLVFKKNYRNIFVFEKFTFPDEKVLTIEISEKQISDKFFNISGGWQWKNTVNAVVGLEFEGKYHNAYELYIDLATAYDKCPVCNKVCSDSFWSYKTFGIGAAYKPTISRGKNSNLRWRFGADLGANRKGFQASIDIGLEYSYSFRNGMQVFVMQKNDFVFWTRDHFRNGLLVGVKFPINK